MLYKNRDSLLFKLISSTVIFLFALNNLSFGAGEESYTPPSALSVVSSFNPIVDVKWDDEKAEYKITETHEKSENFRDSSCLLYVKSCIERFLETINFLRSKKVEDRLLNERLKKFKEALKKKLKDLKFEFENLEWDLDGGLSMRYKNKNGSIQILHYVVPVSHAKNSADNIEKNKQGNNVNNENPNMYMDGKMFAKKYKVARNALQFLKMNEGDPGKCEWMVSAFRSMMEEPKIFAEFMTASIDDGGSSIEEFLSRILRYYADIKNNEDPEFKGVQPSEVSVHILTGSRPRRAILEKMFTRFNICKNEQKKNVNNSKEEVPEPEPRNGLPTSRVQAVAIWKTMKRFFDEYSIENPGTDSPSLWIGGDTLFFPKDEAAGKPRGSIEESHKNLVGETLEVISAGVVIKVNDCKLQVSLLNDRAKIEFRDKDETLTERDLNALKTLEHSESQSEGQSDRTVGDLWETYRAISGEDLVKAASGFRIQDLASFPLIRDVVGDPYVVVGFPAWLTSHQLQLSGLGVEVLDYSDIWPQSYYGEKICTYSSYWRRKFNESKDYADKQAVVDEFYEFAKKYPKTFAQYLWEIRRSEITQNSDSFYVRVLARFLSKDQKQAESVLQYMIQLERNRLFRDENYVLPDIKEKAINFYTSSKTKVYALKALVGRDVSKFKVNKRQPPIQSGFFEENFRKLLKAIPGQMPIPQEDRRGLIAVFAFEKLCSSIISPVNRTSRFAVTSETQMFLDRNGNGNEVLFPPQNAEEEGRLIEAIGGKDVEASSTVVVADVQTGEVRFGSGIALLIMNQATKELDDDEKTLLLRELGDPQYQDDRNAGHFLEELKSRINMRSTAKPVTVGDVREFFKLTRKSNRRIDGMVFLAQDPLFFATINRIVGDPVATIAFPWQDTVDILIQMDKNIIHFKSQKERKKRYKNIIESLFPVSGSYSKIKEVPSRQLEDVKKKKDLYQSIRNKYLEKLNREKPASPKDVIVSLEADENSNIRRIDSLVNASRLSLHMVHFREAVEFIHEIYRQYIREDVGPGGGAKSFIKKVYVHIDRKIKQARKQDDREGKARFEKEKEYWEAFETSVRYIYDNYNLGDKCQKRIKDFEEKEFLRVFGDGTEPFGSYLWDYNVAPLGEQTELFRRLNDVANVWNRWDDTEKIDPLREVDLDAVEKGEKPSDFRSGKNFYFPETDRKGYDFYTSGKDQYAGEKLWRMYSGLRSMISQKAIFQTLYKIDLKEIRDLLDRLTDPTVEDEDRTKAIREELDSEFGSKFRDLIESMVSSDFEEDFPFRSMTLLQRQKFISDQSMEMIHVMMDALISNKANKKETTVAVYFNNAGAETWWNLYQVFVLINLGFKVTIVVPEAPVLNKDVTCQDIQFMIPYMDAYLHDKDLYGEGDGISFLGKALTDDNPQLNIRPIRIDLKNNENTDIYPCRIKEDLEDRVPSDFQDIIRKNIVELVKEFNFNIMIGELWYGYYLGMGELLTDPINSYSPDKKEKNRFIGGVSDNESMQGRSFSWQTIAKRIQPTKPNSKGHVLTVHVHKNIRQQVAAFVPPKTDGREYGGMPNPTLTYGNFDAHYFYPRSWQIANKRFYYHGNVDMEKIMNDPDIADKLIKTFGDAAKFFFSIKEDQMEFVVYDATKQARDNEDRLIKERQDGKIIDKAYDFVYRTPSRRIRIRVCEYKGAQEFRVNRGGEQGYENANGHVAIQFSINFEELLRKIKYAPDNEGNINNLLTRFQELPMVQSKIPSLFRGHFRNAVREFLVKQRKNGAAVLSDFDITNPKADYILERKRVETSNDFLIKHSADDEEVYVIPVKSKTEAAEVRISLDAVDKNCLGKFIDKALIPKEKDGISDKDVPLIVQVVKFYNKNDGMERLYQYVPAWIERKDNIRWLVFSVPNLPEKLEIMDIVKIPIPGDDLCISMMHKKDKRPRLFISRLNEDQGLDEGSIPDKYSPSEATRQSIKNGTFWFSKVLTEGMNLPRAIVAPIDYRSQTEERLMIQRMLERKNDGKALIYSDLVRIGCFYDDPRDVFWWDYYDYTTGLPRLDYSDSEDLSIIQLAGPHDVALTNHIFDKISDTGSDKVDLKDNEEQIKKECKNILKAFRAAAYLAVKNGAKGLNINMGSSSLRMQYANGESISGGAGLIARPILAALIVKSVRKGAQSALKLNDEEAKNFPVSVKTRLADNPKNDTFDIDKTVEFLKQVTEAGASWITVHTRLPKDDFLTSARGNRKVFAQAVNNLHKLYNEGRLSVAVPPIFINGEISTQKDLEEVKKLGDILHGVMIGQAISARRNFDILRKAISYFDTGDTPEKNFKELSDTEKVSMLRDFLRFSADRLGVKFFWKERIFPAFRGFVKYINVNNLAEDDRNFINGIEKIGSGNPEKAAEFLNHSEELERDKYIAKYFRDTVIDMAMDAKKEGRVILLGLDESWIKYKRGADEVIAELQRLPGKLKNNGLDNVIFKRANGDDLAEVIDSERKKHNASLPLSNIIVLGGKNILSSDKFKRFRNYKLQESALLIGVDNKNLNTISGIRLLEVFLLALKLKSVTLPETSEQEYNEKVFEIYEKLFKSLDTRYVKIDMSFNKGFWNFIFTPIKPYNIDESKERNEIQVKAFDIKA